MATASSVIDPLNTATLNASIWNSFTASTATLTATTTGVAMAFASGSSTTAASAGFQTDAYNLTFDSFQFQTVSAPTVSNAGAYAQVIDGTTGAYVGWGWDSGQITSTWNPDGSTYDSGTSATYSTTTHKYLKVSISGSTVTWYTSTNGTTWTTFDTRTLTAMGMTSFSSDASLGLLFGIYLDATVSNGGTFKVVNVNPSSAVPASVTGVAAVSSWASGAGTVSSGAVVGPSSAAGASGVATPGIITAGANVAGPAAASIVVATAGTVSVPASVGGSAAIDQVSAAPGSVTSGAAVSGAVAASSVVAPAGSYSVFIPNPPTPHSFSGSATVDDSLGGSAHPAVSTLGGSTSITPNTLGGTAADANTLGAAATVVDTLGGTAVPVDTLGGSLVVSPNSLGGTAFGGTVQEVDIALNAFNDAVVTFSVTDSGSPYDLTGKVVHVLFKAQRGDLDTKSTTKTYSSDGDTPAVTITDAANGACSLTIPDADLNPNAFAFYRLDVVDGTTQQTAIFGTVTITSL